MADPFHVRFNIDVNLDEAKQRFIHRIENYVLMLMRELRDHYSNVDLSITDSIMIQVEIGLGEQGFIRHWQERTQNINDD